MCLILCLVIKITGVLLSFRRCLLCLLDRVGHLRLSFLQSPLASRLRLSLAHRRFARWLKWLRWLSEYCPQLKRGLGVRTFQADEFELNPDLKMQTIQIQQAILLIGQAKCDALDVIHVDQALVKVGGVEGDRPPGFVLIGTFASTSLTPPDRESNTDSVGRLDRRYRACTDPFTSTARVEVTG